MLRPLTVVFAAALALAGAAAAGPPANDAFTAPATLAGERGEVAGSNAQATAERDEPAHVTDAAHSVWFRWTAPGEGAVTFETCGSDFDTMLAVYTGTALRSLSRVGADDDSCGVASAVTFLAAAGTTYAIVVDGFEGDRGDFVLSWRRAASPANDGFGSAAALDGRSGSTSGTLASSTREPAEPSHTGRGGTVWYEWIAPASGVVVGRVSLSLVLAVYTGPSLAALTFVRAADEDDDSELAFEAVAGVTYRFAVAGPSSPAARRFTLSWEYAPAPENDAFDRPHMLVGERGEAEAPLLASSTEPGEPSHGLAPGGGSVWFAWRAPSTTRIAFTACGGGALSSAAVYTGDSVAALRRVGATTGTCKVGGRIAVDAVAGTVYRIAVAGSRSMLWWAFVEWARPPQNDDFADATVLADGVVRGTTDGATHEAGEGEHRRENSVASVWFAWTAPASGFYTIDTCRSTADAEVAVYSGDSVQTLVGVASAGAPECDRGSAIRFAAVAGTTYRVAVDSTPSTRGEFTLQARPSARPLNDAFARARRLTGASGEVAGTTVAATRERREPRATRNTGASVWYRWTAPRSGWFTFESCGGFEMVVGVYRGAGLRSLRRLGTSSNACSSSGGAYVRAERGVEYRVVVTGFGSGTGDFSLAWRATPAPACVVPYVVEFPLADARRMIADRHCTVVVRYVTSTLLRPGRVVGQSPRSGTKLRYGATVTIEIARR